MQGRKGIPPTNFQPLLHRVTQRAHQQPLSVENVLLFLVKVVEKRSPRALIGKIELPLLRKNSPQTSHSPVFRVTP